MIFMVETPVGFREKIFFDTPFCLCVASAPAKCDLNLRTRGETYKIFCYPRRTKVIQRQGTNFIDDRGGGKLLLCSLSLNCFSPAPANLTKRGMIEL